ncbi:hypothetical protein GGI1_05915, partial [Acidithiobacillus sp. GGI-221]
MAHQHGQGRCRRETLHGGIAVLQEVATQEQIFGRVTTERQLRRQQQIGASRLRLGGGGQQTIGVARHIADPAVDLRQGDTHQPPQYLGG